MPEKEESDDEMSIASAPDDCIFPCHMALFLWGPLVDPAERLLSFETGSAKKNNEALSRGAKRKLELEEKEAQHSSDNNRIRSFNADQRISIECLIAQQKMQ